MSCLGIDDVEIVSMNSCNVSFFTANGMTYRPSFTASLPSAPMFLFRVDKDRVDETKIFINQRIPEIFRASSKVTLDTSKTYFYHNLLRALNELSISNSDRKQCFIYGDGLEHGDVSWYTYRSNPKGLIDDQELLKDKLIELYGEMPDLSGIIVKLIHVPQKKDLALFEYSSRFLKGLIEENNGSFFLETCSATRVDRKPLVSNTTCLLYTSPSPRD